MNNTDRNILKIKAHKLTGKGYNLTYKFPKEEIFCLTAQVRRALISVPSNIIEGYSRNRSRAFVNHLEIAYGSLAEAKYQIYFAYTRKYISKKEYLDFFNDAEEISKMLWSSIKTIYDKNKFKNE
ncbi:MAG TPA: four helix bundle protein [Candidatus Moranbacteria bacterium]|nr:four helix bundle protein [Candidatus Moranbacteria bacterium]